MNVRVNRVLTYDGATYNEGDVLDMQSDHVEQLEANGIVERYRPPSVFSKMLSGSPENKMASPPENKRKGR